MLENIESNHLFNNNMNMNSPYTPPLLNTGISTNSVLPPTQTLYHQRTVNTDNHKPKSQDYGD